MNSNTSNHQTFLNNDLDVEMLPQRSKTIMI